MLKPNQVEERARTQAQGMTDIGPPFLAGATFPPAEITADADALKTLIDRHELAEALYHTSTQQLGQATKALHAKLERNVSYYSSKLGPTNPLNLKVGGKVRKAHGGRPRKGDAGGGGKEGGSDPKKS